jgi:hemolysin-activating ACP:hemolysin acyltransferase
VQATRKINGSAQAPARPRPKLRAFRPGSPVVALGLAVDHLMTMPAFAGLGFGEWSKILVGQINRNQYCFIVDDTNQVQGFLGWALATRERAEAWVEGRGGASYQHSRDSDCVIFNALVSKSLNANHVLQQEARKIMVGKKMVYFKRHYKDGTTRPVRLTVNEFVSRHVDRSRNDA